MKKNEREIASLAMRFMIGNRKQKSFRCKLKWEMYPLRMLVQGLAYNVRKKSSRPSRVVAFAGDALEIYLNKLLKPKKNHKA